jgi:hypothetical protein
MEQTALGRGPSRHEVVLFLLFYGLGLIWSNALFLPFARLFLVPVGEALTLPLRLFLLYLLRYFGKVLLYLAAAVPASLLVLIPAAFLGGLAAAIVTTPIPARFAAFGPYAFGFAAILAILYLLLTLLVLFFLLLRFYPTFFAAITGRKLRIGEAWSRMKGHTARLGLTLLPPILLSMMTGGLYFFTGTPLRLQAAGYIVPWTVKAGIYATYIGIAIVNYVAAGWLTGTLAAFYRDFWPQESDALDNASTLPE